MKKLFTSIIFCLFVLTLSVVQNVSASTEPIEGTDYYTESGEHVILDLDFNGYYVCEADYVLKMKKLYSVDLPYEQLPDSIKDRFYPNGDMHRMYVCEITQYLENEE